MKIKLNEAEILINNFINDFLDGSLLNISKTKVEAGDNKLNCFYKDLKKAGPKGPAIQLWNELWSGRRRFAICIGFFSKNTFKKYFPNKSTYKPY